MDFGDQRREVHAWLEDLFGDEPIPEFEVNAATIDYLHQLLLINRGSDRNVQFLVDDLEQKMNEYNTEAQRLSIVLSRLGMGPSSLSQSGSSSAQTLAKLGTLLDVRDSSDSCYYLAVQDLDDQLEQVQEQRRLETRKLEQLTVKTHDVVLRCNTLNKALDDVKTQTTESQVICGKRKNDIAFLLNKMKKYGNEISKLQKQLTEAKAHESVFHENLVKNSEKLKSLQDKLIPMQSELQSYSIVPPDLAETKIKIEQQKRELAELEKKVAESIDSALL